MLLYDKRKQDIDTENKRRRNPMYQPPQMALPTGGKPLTKQQPGMAGTPIQPKEEPKPWENSSFFKVKQSIGKQNPDFNQGRDAIEQIASQLRASVEKGEMPTKLAEKKLRMAIEDFARESKDSFNTRKEQEKATLGEANTAKDQIGENGAKLRRKVIDAREGDKAAQMTLRKAKFDWIGNKADAVVDTYGGE